MGNLPGPDRYVILVRGILERLRMSGGITHHWLQNWLDLAGTKRYGAIWGRRPDGMPAFPSGLSAPRFLTGQRRRGQRVRRRGHPPGLVRRLDRPLPRHRGPRGCQLPA
jgi:hypothetical protein